MAPSRKGTLGGELKPDPNPGAVLTLLSPDTGISCYVGSKVPESQGDT